MVERAPFPAPHLHGPVRYRIVPVSTCPCVHVSPCAPPAGSFALVVHTKGVVLGGAAASGRCPLRAPLSAEMTSRCSHLTSENSGAVCASGWN